MRMQNPTETKRNFSMKIGVGEDMVVEDVMVVEVTKITTSTEEGQAKKIGVAEDVVKEVVVRIIPTSNATSVGSMVIMRRIVTPTNVTTVTKWDILQKTVESKRRLKKQPT